MARRGNGAPGATEVDVDGLMSVADSALGKLRASRADAGEVFIQAGWGLSCTLEGGSIKYGSHGTEFGIGVRVIRKGRAGFAYCTRERDMKDALRSALDLTRIAPETRFTFPSPGKVRRSRKTWDPDVLSLSEEDGLGMMREMTDSAREVSDRVSFPGGGVGFGAEAFCVANTEGVEVGDRGTFLSAGISTMLGKEGSASVSTGHFDDFTRGARLDLAGIGRRAATLAVESQGARPLERPGKMDVVFDPDAFSELAEHLLATSFYGDRVSRGESFYSGRRGDRVASERLTVTDDGLLPDGPNSACVDDEGVASGRVKLMEKGVVKNFLYDMAASEETGNRPTGSGVRVDRFGSDRSFKIIPKTRARNLDVAWEGRKDLDGLIGEVKDGVYVHELLGSHTANVVSGDFSVGSSLLFRIQKGELAGPLRGVMLAGNFFRALEDIGGMADDVRNVTGSLSSVAVRTSSVWLRDINVMV